MLKDHPVYLISAARTPIGAFLGELASFTAPQLAKAAIVEALKRSSLPAEQVDEVWIGNVLSAGLGQAPARQAAKGAGIPDKTPATTINKVCGSGLQAVVLGAKSIVMGDAQVVLAGGMESMSQAPYLLPKARSGLRLGHASLVDSVIHDGLWDPYHQFHMGNAADLCAKEFSFSREAQDAFAAESYRRAIESQKSGAFTAEMVPVTIAAKDGDKLITEDEEPKRAKLEKLPTLKPAFGKEGTVTAANASKLNDGAAALILASEDAVKKYGLQPMARILSYAGHAQAPEKFTTAPVGAIQKSLQRINLKPEDIDLFEINEAFAVVALACTQGSNLDPARVNIRGGAVALGHPIGASGARILTTLLYALKDKNAKRGLASLCIGGGEALAMIVERV
jgi:acetyl-CoA C-acetyltransferase